MGGGGGSKKGLNKKHCVKDIFWVKNFLVKGIFGVRKFCSKKFKVEKCFKVEKILWSKSFWSLKLLLHYSFCQKVHFRTFHEFFFDPTPHPHGGSGLSGHFSHILPSLYGFYFSHIQYTIMMYSVDITMRGGGLCTWRPIEPKPTPKNNLSVK